MPCPAGTAPGEGRSLPGQRQPEGPGCRFPASRHFTCSRRSLPQPSERKSRGNGAQHPEAGSPPGDGELNPLRAGGQRSAHGTSRECPLLPSALTGTSPQPPVLCRQGRDTPATVKGQTCHSSSTVHPAFPARSPLLQLSFPAFPSSTGTQTASRKRKALFSSFHSPSRSQRLPT